MDYRAQEVFQSAAAVAGKGWKIVKLHGVKDDATCTCHKGSECPTPGKHPAGGADWQSRATDDEDQISDWFDYSDENESHRVNVGVRLGKTSGIIDVEVDGPEAEETLKKYGLDKIDTPTYRASRGCHRIFRYEDDLPDVGVVKVDQLEVRLGGGGKAAQSVMPSSWHRTGIQYLWLPGMSPDEVEPAPLPPEFKEAVRKNSKDGGSGAIAQAKEVLVGNIEVGVGNRHGYLIGVASWLCANLRSHTEEDRHIVSNILLAQNRALPMPKTVEEVMRIATDQFQHYAGRALERQNNRERPYEQFGLEWNPINREWDQGGWRLTVIHSDPVEYRLAIPLNGRMVSVSMNASQLVKDVDVAHLIMEASGRVDVLNPTPDKWRETWMGKRVRDGDGWRNIVGLKNKLLENAEELWPSVDSCQWSQHASILLIYLRPFSRSDEDEGDDDPPCADGTPKWIKKDGRWAMYFKWHEMLRLAWRNLRVPLTVEQERVLKRKILEVTGEVDFVTSNYRRNGDSLGRFKVWGPQHLEALDKLTGA